MHVRGSFNPLLFIFQFLLRRNENLVESFPSTVSKKIEKMNLSMRRYGLRKINAERFNFNDCNMILFHSLLGM